MFPFNWFPGTNMHDLDLDWVIKTVKDLWKRMDAFTVKTIEIIVDTVNTWLDEHPEATTTVQDGAITFSKLNESMLGNALQVPYMATDEDSIKWQTLGVTPQMYGAAADGETDDTEAVKAALENNNFIFFPEGTYLCDWKAMDLTGKHIKGANKDKTIIKHRNFGYPFGIVGQYTTISDLTFTTENNVELTPALVFGWYNEDFTLFNGHCLNNIKFICDTFTRAIMFNMDGRGSLGGDIHDIYINGGYSGIECILQRNLTHGSSSGTGWITGQTFDNIVITDYKKYGFAIRFMSDTGRMFSHNKISGVRCEAFNDGSIGFALVPDSYTIINPVVFNDNQEGTAYSIEFAPEEYISSRYPTIVGGTMEGALINKQFMYQYDLIGTIFIIRNNINSSNTYRYVPKVQSILYGKEFIDSYSSLSGLDTAYKSNVTIGGGIDSYGKYIRLTRTAAGNSVYGTTLQTPETLASMGSPYITLYAMWIDNSGNNDQNISKIQLNDTTDNYIWRQKTTVENPQQPGTYIHRMVSIINTSRLNSETVSRIEFFMSASNTAYGARLYRFDAVMGVVDFNIFDPELNAYSF